MNLLVGFTVQSCTTQGSAYIPLENTTQVLILRNTYVTGCVGEGLALREEEGDIWKGSGLLQNNKHY